MCDLRIRDRLCHPTGDSKPFIFAWRFPLRLAGFFYYSVVAAVVVVVGGGGRGDGGGGGGVGGGVVVVVVVGVVGVVVFHIMSSPYSSLWSEDRLQHLYCRWGCYFAASVLHELHDTHPVRDET